MNTWIFSGNVGRDAELRYTQTGTPVLSFSVAVKAGYGDRASTVWANCSLFGKRGESLAPYVLKGASVVVGGELSEREWTDKQGEKRTSIDVKVSEIDLMGGNGKQANNSRPTKDDGGQAHANQMAEQQKAKDAFSDAIDDDIPFNVEAA